ncbi:hypothetical protein ACPOL_4633 [Acidisarcina polymorpha]|uniref:Uncharacterized protein n=1 Tax=Acidisarcina polymorpha TaxID=2211140 RepID=A0A2Z5G5I7_9BACT|nr:hypothetical protein ACPOL_4633 [Acidisarcina polymorpha]
MIGPTLRIKSSTEALARASRSIHQLCTGAAELNTLHVKLGGCTHPASANIASRKVQNHPQETPAY